MDEFSWFDINLLIVIAFVMCYACVWFGKRMDEDLKRDEEELKKETDEQ
jgi:hypothetical protein